MIKKEYTNIERTRAQIAKAFRDNLSLGDDCIYAKVGEDNMVNVFVRSHDGVYDEFKFVIRPKKKQLI